MSNPYGNPYGSSNPYGQPQSQEMNQTQTNQNPYGANPYASNPYATQGSTHNQAPSQGITSNPNNVEQSPFGNAPQPTSQPQNSFQGGNNTNTNQNMQPPQNNANNFDSSNFFGQAAAMGAAAMMAGQNNSGDNAQQSEQMAGAAIGMAGQFMQQNEAAKAAMGFGASITANARSYFAVTQGYVFKKMIYLLCPFIKIMQTTNGHGSGPSYGQGPQSDDEHQVGSYKTDVDSADLYVPSMSIVTYILLYGICKGAMAGDFHPEIMGSSLSFVLVLLILEVILFKVGFWVAKTQNINTLDLVAFAGYKYFSACMICIVTLLFSTTALRLPLLLYFALCSAAVVWAALRHLKPDGSGSNSDWRGNLQGSSMLYVYVVYACAACQVPLLWILSPAAGAAVAEAPMLGA